MVIEEPNKILNNEIIPILSYDPNEVVGPSTQFIGRVSYINEDDDVVTLVDRLTEEVMYQGKIRPILKHKKKLIDAINDGNWKMEKAV